MQNTTVSTAKNNLEFLINSILEMGETVNIATNDGNVIMLSEFEYRSLLETLDIYAHPDYMQSLIDAANESREDWVEISEEEWEL
ncbi:MAG: hypothetical protein LBC56_08630 [Oscillospiraceae bacterium]|nr:hypothetical protein [Oscillospiraceae bacterium]